MRAVDVTDAPHVATMAAVRTFNTAGPVVAADHYHIPPLERIDLAEVLELIRDKKYFVLHAPRQTGKTSALRDLLNGGAASDYRCVYANVEAGQAMRENVRPRPDVPATGCAARRSRSGVRRWPRLPGI